jgi:hypothetical protein
MIAEKLYSEYEVHFSVAILIENHFLKLDSELSQERRRNVD